MPKKKKIVRPADSTPAEQLGAFLVEAEAVVRKAKRFKKSVKGDNSYAEQFHNAQTQAMRIFREMQTQVVPTADTALARTISDVEKELIYFFDPRFPDADRRELRREIDMLVKSEIEPAYKSSKSASSEFIPAEIANGTRGYVIRVTNQINGCFQADCFDACGVMIRRLLETLIIEVFEEKGLESEIKDSGGNYFMFTDFVSKLISTPQTPVGRTTRKELPTIAIVLNNCAHNRTFNISKPQLVQYQAAIVIAVQELISLWDIRKP